jgi:hypothetical protein
MLRTALLSSASLSTIKTSIRIDGHSHSRDGQFNLQGALREIAI